MAQLIVRNLQSDLVRRLKQRAARHGRSTEAEHRAILHDALHPSRPRRTFKALLFDMPDVGSEADFRRRPDRARKVRW
jgi:antitoxin FitA